MDRLENEVCIVTGAGQGIGRAIAERFAEESARVAVIEQQSEEGQSAVETIRQNGGQAEFWHGDVSDWDRIDEITREIDEQWGSIDVVVNNAGIRQIKDFMEMTLEDWNRVISVDLTGVFVVSRLAAPYMADQGGGSIVNIASVASKMGLKQRASYCASKGGVNGLTNAMAKELADYDIRVNSIHPGFIKTDLTGEYAEDSHIMELIRSTPAGRWGTPEEVADAALHLAGSEAEFVTGSSYYVDGGITHTIDL